MSFINPKNIVQPNSDKKPILLTNIVQSAPQQNQNHPEQEKTSNPEPEPEKSSKDILELAQKARQQMSAEKLKLSTKTKINYIFGISTNLCFILDTDMNRFYASNKKGELLYDFQIPYQKCVLFEEKTPLAFSVEKYITYNAETQELINIPFEYSDPIHVQIDPITSSRIFFLTQNHELIVIQRDKKQNLRTKIIKTNVDYFDVSRKHLLIVKDGNMEIWPRIDAVSSPLWTRKLESKEKTKYYLDDYSVYECYGNNVSVHSVIEYDKILYTYHNVTGVWKSVDVAVGFQEGIRVGGVLFPSDSPVICAAVDKKSVVLWHSPTEAPSIHERLSIDEDVEADDHFTTASREVLRAAHELVRASRESLKTGLENFSKTLEENTKPTSAVLEEVSRHLSTVGEAVSTLAESCRFSGASAPSLVEILAAGDAERAFEMALASPEPEFRRFCLCGRAENALNEGKLSQALLLKLGQPLRSAFDDDPAGFAGPILSLLLAIDSVRTPEVAELADDILATAIGAYQRVPPTQPCVKTIRMITHVAVSLKSN